MLAGNIDKSDQYISDVECMLKTRTGNDIKIILEDSEIYANKDILVSRSEYFKTMFNNEYQFLEGERNSVDMSHCSKAIMEKIIIYLFSGKMKLDDLSFPDGIRILNMARLMMMGDLCDEIDTDLLRRMPYLTDRDNICQLPELLEGLVLIEQFKLDYFKKDSDIYMTIFLHLKGVVNVPEIVLKADVFKSFPEHLMKDILLLDLDKVILYQTVVPRSALMANQTTMRKIMLAGSTTDRFQAFLFWLSDNIECSEVTKTEIVDSFDLSEFTGEELITIVKKSGFFTQDQIEQGLLKIIKKKDQDIRSLEVRLPRYQDIRNIRRLEAILPEPCPAIGE